MNSKGDQAPATILVVEDEYFVREDTCHTLRDQNWQVIEANTADEAISILTHNGKIDLVFSDIQMPGQADGIVLARWTKEYLPHIPVILTSGGYSSEQLEDVVWEEGPIPKPYDHAHLIARIKYYLSRRESLD